MAGRSLIVNGLKQCGLCKEWFPTTNFYKNKRATTGLYSSCIPCTRKRKRESQLKNPVSPELRKEYRRRYHEKYPERVSKSNQDQSLKKNYGLTLEERNTLARGQDFKCAICETPEEKVSRGRLHVDHHHETSQVRGLLCSGCNFGLGQFKDSVTLLQNAIDYLKKGDN